MIRGPESVENSGKRELSLETFEQSVAAAMLDAD